MPKTDNQPELSGRQKSTAAQQSLTLRSLAQTRRLARAMAKTVRAGDTLSLLGPLGCGKTTFTSGFVAAMPGGATIPVSSPTFTTVNTYPCVPEVYHMDLYRLAPGLDPELLGYEEYFAGEGICLVEWLDRAPYLAPPDFLQMQFLLRAGHSRRVILSAQGPRSQRWLADAMRVLAIK